MVRQCPMRYTVVEGLRITPALDNRQSSFIKMRRKECTAGTQTRASSRDINVVAEHQNRLPTNLPSLEECSPQECSVISSVRPPTPPSVAAPAHPRRDRRGAVTDSMPRDPGHVPQHGPRPLRRVAPFGEMDTKPPQRERALSPRSGKASDPGPGTWCTSPASETSSYVPSSCAPRKSHSTPPRWADNPTS